MPFDPWSERIGEVLGDQLTAEADEALADRALVWDALDGRYRAALRLGGAAAPGWFSLGLERVASDLTLPAGSGFFIENRHSVTQHLVLAGEVILDPERVQALATGPNLTGYPFSTAAEVTATALPGDLTILTADGSPASRFALGSGYWLPAPSDRLWAEPRPYSAPFPSDDAPPVITRIAVSADGREAELLLEGGLNTSCRWELYAQDLTPDTPFDPSRNWTLAAGELSPGADGLARWTDRLAVQGGSQAPIFGRCYLVGRADVDGDGDTLPNARERFVHGTDPAREDTDGDGITDGFELRRGTDPLIPDSPGGMAVGRVIHVNARLGDDRFDGRAARAQGASGPKKTIAAGLAEAVRRRAGGHPESAIIEVAEGTYRERVDVPAGVLLCTQGRVVVEE